MPAKKLTIGVIFGGRSGEHEVSLVSAASVIANLDHKKYHVVPVGITKDGHWITENSLKALTSGNILEQGSRLLPEQIIKKCDVMFPVLHGSYGEDGTIQGMLEMAGVAYVGAGVLGSAVAMDKVIQKVICDYHRLPSTAYDWFFAAEWQHSRRAIVARLERRLGYPMFTKPANLGSSVAISKCHNRRELFLGVATAAQYDHKIIVEKAVNNAREIEVSVLGSNRDPRASVPGEIIASNEFYDYDAKYVDGKSQAIIPARLPKKTIKEIQRIAVAAFKVLGLDGMARIDFFVSKRSNRVYLNEPNTIPGFTSISMYAKLWQASGLSYPRVLDRLIALALERQQQKNALLTSYQPKQEWYK